MNTLVYYPHYGGIGGIARYIESFFQNIPHKDRKKFILLTSDNFHFKPIEGIKIISLPLKGDNRLSLFLWGLKGKKTIEKLYSEGHIDLVNIHIPPTIPYLILPNIPVILTAHTTDYGLGGRYYQKIYFKQNRSYLEEMLRLSLEKKIYSNAEKIITLTPQGADELKYYHVPSEKISICPNGVDSQYFKPEKTEKDIDVLFIGRIEARKGSRSIPEVIKELVRLNESIKICIVGYGTDFDYLKLILGKYIDTQQVILTGKIPLEDVHVYYDRSKIYISTSYYEGLPGTCLEAMSKQLPVVVWDFLFYKDLVADSENGFVIPVNNFSFMAQAANDLIIDKTKRIQMGQKARQKVIMEYNWKSISTRLLSVIDRFETEDV